MKKPKLLLLGLALLLFHFTLLAQTRTITGTVTDSHTGDPISGASVNVRNSKIGASADEKGVFKLQIPPSLSHVVLIISSVGYSPQEVTPKEDNVVVRLISSGNKTLNDVVVVGYGTAKKATLTGAVSSIKSKEVTE